MVSRTAVLLVVWVAAAAVAPPAYAQYRSERPYRGLFGSGLVEADQSLVASASAGGGFDNNVVAALTGDRGRASNLNTSFRGGVAQGSGSLRYSLNLAAISLNASGGTSLSYYPSLSDSVLRRYSGSVGTGVRVTRNITANASVQYMPYSIRSLFPDLIRGLEAIGVPDLDFASSIEHHFTYSAGAGYQKQLSRRRTVSADYSYRWRDASPLTGRQYADHHASGRLTHQIDPGLSLRAGYGYRQSQRTFSEESEATVRTHHIDAGVDYNRALSFSRRTTLSFDTGTAVIARPDPDNTRTRFRLTGNARLEHEIGRTWSAEVAYGRNVRFDETFGDLVSSDGVSAAFGGMVSQRLSFLSSARTSLGRIGGGNSDYRGTYGNAVLSYHLGRHASAGLTYAYYRHRFDGGLDLPPDFASAYNRHSIRASVSLWAPIWQSTRRR